MGDDSKILQDDKNLWPEDLKQREEQWQKNGGSPSSTKRFDRKPPSPPMPPPSDDKGRSRSRSRERRRSRSRSRSRGYSPDERYRRRRDAYDYRTRPMRRSPERRPVRRERERSRERTRNRSRSRDRRDRSSSRGRSRRDWSPKGRRSPIRRPTTPQAPPPPNIAQVPPPYIPQPLYSDGYNYSANVPPYGQGMPPQQFGGYDFPGQGAQSYVPPYPPPPPVLIQPGAPGDDFGRPSVWGVPPSMGQQRQIAPQIPIPVESEEDKTKREAAVVQEMQNQRATLKKQREDYQRRASALTRELKILREQRNKLAAVNQPHSPTTRNFLKENDRLQSQIQNKLSTIENVIDMLSGIIGTEKTPSPPSLSGGLKGAGSKSRDTDSDESESEKLKSKLIQSMKKNKKEKIPETNVSRDKLVDPERKVNYVFYDPEMHWCPMCNVFPKSAKDYLNHLHSKEHMSTMKNQDSPWHEKQQNDEFPNYPNAPTKRTPIRGLQFFTAATAWYCKLCAVWMGDLHCASTHLKSKVHADNYNAYADQNPHFDVDWMADRQKAYDIYREKAASGKKSPTLMHVIPLQPDDDSDKKSKKKKKKVDGKKEKKKRKRNKRRRQSSSSSSSSSSSDSDSDSDKKDTSLEASLDDVPANSIRVSMRNMTKPSAPLTEDDNAVGKWTMVQPAQVTSHTPFAPPAPSISTEAKKRDELIISQWTPGPVISESERKLLDDLKGKLKKRSEVDGGNGPDERRRSRDRTPDRRTRRRSRSRGRYSRSRSRSRSPYYNRYGRRRSSSRGRRSNSRGRRVIEKPVVNYPPEPKRINEKKSKGKDGNGERKKSPPKKKVPPPPKGKLPFIGRMPVFKKQVAAEDAAKQKEAEVSGDVQSQSTPAAVKTPTHSHSGMSQGGSMDDELMPDPTQYMVLLSGGGPAPPPPPMQDLDKNEEVLPPGIDEAEADLVPKPISDAPRPRKGPLPKDFQDALDLIFPDEKKKETVAEPIPDSNREPVDMEGVTAGDSIPDPGVGIEEVVAQAPPMGIYNTYGTAFPGGTGYAVYEGIPGAIQTDSPGIVPPPPPIDMDTGNSADNSIPHVEMAIEENRESSMNKIELDDLALLGIDADDMAAQCM